MSEMIYKPLGKTGLDVSIIGFGAGPLGNEYGAISNDEAVAAFRHAVDRGVNIVDTSPYYGRTLSEERLGHAMRDGYRERVILCTKAGRYDKDLPHGFDFSEERLMRSVEESLSRLQTDYIDVYHLHDIEFTQKSQILNESLPTMVKLKEAGKVRFIGVTGYPIHLLAEVLDAFDVDAVLSYCHYNLMNTTMNEILIPVAQRKNVGVMNASTLHMGVLTKGGEQAWHPAPKRVLETGRRVTEYCEEQGASITELALQFALQNPYVATTFVGMRTRDEVDQNVSVVGTEPDPELLSAVQKMIEPVFNVAWKTGLPENDEPNAVPPNV